MKALFCTALLLALNLNIYAQNLPIARVHIDATKVENRISPRMYAAFTEMMAEDVKRGLTAEMLRDRSFESATDYLGLPAHWQLEPDERNDNVGAIHFAQTAVELIRRPTRQPVRKIIL